MLAEQELSSPPRHSPPPGTKPGGDRQPWFRAALRWAAAAIAVVMLLLTALPASVWHAPVNDAVYNGFDPKLLYTSSIGASAIRVSQDTVDMTNGQYSQSTVNLFTDAMQKLNASVDFTVDQNGASEPFRIGLWSPWTSSGEFIDFKPQPDHLVTATTITKGPVGKTLVDVPGADTKIGQYQDGALYHFAAALDRSAGNIAMSITGPGITQTDVPVSPTLFGDAQVTLTASSTPYMGTSHIVLSNFNLTVPHQRLWAAKIDDPVASALLVGLGVFGAVLLALAVLIHAPNPRASRGYFPAERGRGFRFSVWVVGAVALYAVVNALLIPLGGHPFDMGDEKLYAYVAHTYGPAQLYFVPNLVSMSWIWGGLPYIEAAFPYEPVSGWLHTAIGAVGGLLFGDFGPRSAQIEYLTKATMVVFGLVDAGLIYGILRQIGTSRRWSYIAAALFLFNPAVWFSMSVWGQSHVFSLCLVLTCVLMIEKRHPTWAWLALAAAVLTRPQMLVFGMLLSIVLLRKFSWRESVAAISWTVIIVFIALLPFTLATSPSLPVDVMLHNFNVQETGGNVNSLTTVSQDSYSLWPLVTYFVRGVSGVQRMFTPSSDLLIGSLSYQRVSQILTGAVLLGLAGVLAFWRRATEGPGAYLPYVTLGIVSFLMLMTGILATHFLLALPFVLLGRRWLGNTAYFYVVAIWTVTTLIPMYGDMGSVLTAHDYPLLAQSRSAITRAVIDLYASDRFITAGVVSNICALVWVGYLALRALRTPRGVLAE